MNPGRSATGAGVFSVPSNETVIVARSIWSASTRRWASIDSSSASRRVSSPSSDAIWLTSVVSSRNPCSRPMLVRSVVTRPSRSAYCDVTSVGVDRLLAQVADVDSGVERRAELRVRHAVDDRRVQRVRQVHVLGRGEPAESFDGTAGLVDRSVQSIDSQVHRGDEDLLVIGARPPPRRASR